MVGLVRVAGELRFHALEARGALVLAGVTLAGGTILGLWLPRLAIRWRLGGQPVPVAGFDVRFVANVVGGLLVAQAVLWAALFPLLSGLESYRAWLVDSFGLSPTLLRGLLLAPVIGALALLAAVSATMLVSAHVWQRLRTWPQTHLSDTWLTIATAVGASALLLRDSAGSVVLAGIAVLLAAALTRWPQQRATPVVGATDSGPGSATVAGLLVAIAIGAALTGAVIIFGVQRVMWLGTALAPTLAGYSISLLLGVVAGRLLMARLAGRWGGAVLLAGVIIAVALSQAVTRSAMGAAAGWLMAAATAALVVWMAELLTGTGRRAGRVLGLVGTAALAGLGGAWLVVGVVSQGADGSGSTAVRAVDAAELPEWLALRAWQCAVLDSDIDDPRCWDVDLQGPRTDALLLAFPESAGSVRTDLLPRALLRFRRLLRPGGCLVLPDPPAVMLSAVARAGAGPCYRVTAGTPEAEQIVLCGADVPGILAYIGRLRELTFAVEPLEPTGL